MSPQLIQFHYIALIVYIKTGIGPTFDSCASTLHSQPETSSRAKLFEESRGLLLAQCHAPSGSFVPS